MVRAFLVDWVRFVPPRLLHLLGAFLLGRRTRYRCARVVG